MNNDFRQIALYGKGGIGKSTIACNVAVACQEMGCRVIQVGCSPKTDSTSFLLGGDPQELNILDKSRESGIDENNIMEVIEEGYKGIYCVEAGGPEPAEGCAGRGVSLALDLLVKYRVYERLGTDLVIYDVIGDVVCGGFAQPMRSGYAQEIYLVTSGEMMSLYSSNNICIAIAELSKRGASVRVAGLVNNMRQVKNERELVEEFAERIKVPVITHIPRSDVVQQAEASGGTVVQMRPHSEQADAYRSLAQKIIERPPGESAVPSPLELEDIMELLKKHQLEDLITPDSSLKSLHKSFGKESEGTPFYAGYSSYPQGSGPKTDVSVSPIDLYRKQKGSLRRSQKQSAAGSMQTDSVRKIAIYGKGGVGKSTIASNLSAALSHVGEKVMQVGCDPKRDSISTLCGRLMPTIMDQVAKHRNLTPELLDEVIFTGYNGTKGCESGGPKPGMGCAGKGVNLALQLLDHYEMFQKHGISLAIFDVLGDVVCGGFSQPMRSGYAREIYLVACGEILTLYQVNNITRAVVKLSKMDIEVGVAGIINNMRGVPHEEEIVEEFGKVTGVPVIQHIPRSRVVQDAELQGKTVIEAYPHSELAEVYRSLARKILTTSGVHVPKPTDMKTLKSIVTRF